MDDILKRVLGNKDEAIWEPREGKLKKGKIPFELPKPIVSEKDLITIIKCIMGYFKINDISFPMEIIKQMNNDVEIIVHHDIQRDSLTIKTSRKDFWDAK
jgi:hypothetical protein